MKYCFYLLALMVLCVSAVSCSTTATEQCCPEEEGVVSDTTRSASLSDYIIIEDVIIYRATGTEYIIIEDLIIYRKHHGDYIIIEDLVIGRAKNNPDKMMLFKLDKENGTAEHYESMYSCLPPMLGQYTDYIIIEDVFIGLTNGNEVDDTDHIIIIDVDGI